VRAELDAVRLDFADFGQAENLEAAAIGQDRFVPVHEPMQTAGGGDDFESGPDVQMVRVAEDDLGATLDEFARVHGLDGGLGAHGHVNRRFHGAARRGQATQPRLRSEIGLEEFEHCAQDKPHPRTKGE